MLRDLSCPNCGAPGLMAHQPDGVVTCKFCGNKYANDNSIACPHCETINSPEAGFCTQCGSKLKRNCPACLHENWIGAEYCLNCGRAIDLLEIMADRHASDFRAGLAKHRELAPLIKAEEDAASEKRLSDLWEVERKRQAELARQQAERDRQHNMVIYVALAILGLFLCSVAAFVYFVAMR
ncbi:MAG TPA: zinc ribbon domain-containing protein [Anaerolineales bacterium]|nr:zinc ribbon domain-containing protein [Anaerolineales bacterium]